MDLARDGGADVVALRRVAGDARELRPEGHRETHNEVDLDSNRNGTLPYSLN